jgi:transcriptional regulator with XRE-family HTH domain
LISVYLGDFLELFMLVQKLRLQRGWSQQQLADLSGLSIRTIQRIENGQPASVETMKSLASVFEIDFNQLQPEPAMNTTEDQSTAKPSIAEQITSKYKASNDEMLALAHVRKLKAFYVHLIQYVLVMTLLLVINLKTSPSYLWVIWPALGWGIGLLSHAAAIFDLLSFFGANWEKKQVEKRLGRSL